MSTPKYEDRELTDAEKRWWARFKRCLRDMPKTLEVHVSYTAVGIAQSGAKDAYFRASRFGDIDNLPTIESTHAPRVHSVGAEQL